MTEEDERFIPTHVGKTPTGCMEISQAHTTGLEMFENSIRFSKSNSNHIIFVQIYKYEGQHDTWIEILDTQRTYDNIEIGDWRKCGYKNILGQDR